MFAVFLARAIKVLAAICFSLASTVASAAGTDDLLEPEKAFRFAAKAIDANTVEVSYQIAQGYYLYRERFKFAGEPASVKLGAAEFPPGKVHEDQFFGKMETYRNELRFRIPVADAGGLEKFRLKVVSQGCADVGVCYVPQEQFAEIRLASFTSGTGGGDVFTRLGIAGPRADDGAALTDRPGSVSRGALSDDESSFVGVLESGRWWAALAFFFVAGIALAFTPCVLPMVPILSAVIVGDGHRKSKKRAVMLSLAYVLGMSVTYASIGVAAALSGQLLAAALQSPWVLWTFAIVFVLLALSMFGVYELNLPALLHSRLAAVNHRIPGGQYGGVVLMGMLSAVIVSPCVAAPLAGALLYISQTRDAWLGGAALLAMALGMGIPLLVVGFSEGALLPKSGPWMNTVKQVFGLLMIGVAVWIIAPLIPVVAQMLAWGALLVVGAMLLRALDALPPETKAAARVWKGVGILMLLAGVALVAGALAGSRDPLRPLSGFLGGAAAPDHAVHFERVNNITELDDRLKNAGRPVMLDFYADWCVSCKEMERFTFANEGVRARLANFTLLQVDVTANTAEHLALLKRFRLFGPPGIIFFDRTGGEIQGLRVIGYQNAERFAQVLDRVTSGTR